MSFSHSPSHEEIQGSAHLKFKDPIHVRIVREVDEVLLDVLIHVFPDGNLVQICAREISRQVPSDFLIGIVIGLECVFSWAPHMNIELSGNA